MSIIWKYLDKQKATVAAIRDYRSMKFIINNTEGEISVVRARMRNLGSPAYDGMPHTHNNGSSEDRIVNGIEEIDVLKERYRQATEYMDWFQPAWNELDADERYVLETFYADDPGQTGAVYDICETFNIERSSAYNKKNRALEHLQVLLFGKG